VPVPGRIGQCNLADSAHVAQASSPASSGGVPPPVQDHSNKRIALNCQALSDARKFSALFAFSAVKSFRLLPV